jgi:hypothetical protein
VNPHLDEAYPQGFRNGGYSLRESTQPGWCPMMSRHRCSRITPRSIRTVWMPAGTNAGYRADGVFEFPAGTVLTKTFSFPQKDGTERLIETRLLVRQKSGWIALVYVWNRDQTEALLETAPEPVPVRWVDEAGVERATTYVIPNVNQCTVCHPNGEPIGSDRTERAYSSSGPRRGTFMGRRSRPQRRWYGTTLRRGLSIERARAYLDVNCSSCHREGRKSKPLDTANGRAEMVRRMESLDPERACRTWAGPWYTPKASL